MKAKTTVVNLRYSAFDVYIGRAGHGYDGYFGNPIKVGDVCCECGQIHRDGGSTLGCYTKYLYRRLMSDTDFRDRVLDLQGRRLGCFCKPRPCHGDILAKLADEAAKGHERWIAFFKANEGHQS